MSTDMLSWFVLIVLVIAIALFAVAFESILLAVCAILVFMAGTYAVLELGRK